MSKINSDNKQFIDLSYQWTETTTTEEVRDAYNLWAASYDENLLEDLDYVMPSRAASALAATVSDSSIRIFDVGCGTGLSGRALNAVGFKNIDGCDISTEMLKRARDLGIYGELMEANLVAPPIAVDTGSYDAATAIGVFSHGHLDVNATEEVIRVVKPGGPVVMTTNDHFEDDGKMARKLDQLDQRGVIKMLSAEHGDHLKAKNIGGWVFLMEKI